QDHRTEGDLVDLFTLVVLGPSIEHQAVVRNVQVDARTVPFGRLRQRVVGQVMKEPGIARHSFKPPAQRLRPLLTGPERPADEDMPETALFEVARDVTNEPAAQAVRGHATVAIEKRGL